MEIDCQKLKALSPSFFSLRADKKKHPLSFREAFLCRGRRRDRETWQPKIEDELDGLMPSRRLFSCGHGSHEDERKTSFDGPIH